MTHSQIPREDCSGRFHYRKERRIRLDGLKAESTYRVSCDGKTVRKSGRYLMTAGIRLKMTGDYSSRLILAEEDQEEAEE